MDKIFKFNEAPAKQPVIFDQIFAEKVGGGLVKNAAYDRHPGLAVSANGVCLKAARLVEAITADSTSMKVAKDSGFAVGDVVASGAVGVAITAIDSSHDDYDILTVTLGVAQGRSGLRPRHVPPCQLRRRARQACQRRERSQGDRSVPGRNCRPDEGYSSSVKPRKQ